MTLRMGALIFTIGGAFQTFCRGFTSMVVGRVISGFGVGFLSMVVPIYQVSFSIPQFVWIKLTFQSEISPASHVSIPSKYS